jgi:hypothetical protein
MTADGGSEPLILKEEQIHSYVHDPENGAVMCPHCDLEMGWFGEDDSRLSCGNGHWIAREDVHREGD